MQQMIEEAQRMLLARRAALLRRSAWAPKQALLEPELEPKSKTTIAAKQNANTTAGNCHSDPKLAQFERQELQEIDAALQRISQGLFGRCDECGSSIGRQRLRALPETRFCVRCATAGRRRSANAMAQTQRKSDSPEN